MQTNLRKTLHEIHGLRLLVMKKACYHTKGSHSLASVQLHCNAGRQAFGV